MKRIELQKLDQRVRKITFLLDHSSDQGELGLGPFTVVLVSPFESETGEVYLCPATFTLFILYLNLLVLLMSVSFVLGASFLYPLWPYILKSGFQLIMFWFVSTVGFSKFTHT